MLVAFVGTSLVSILLTLKALEGDRLIGNDGPVAHPSIILSIDSIFRSRSPVCHVRWVS